MVDQLDAVLVRNRLRQRGVGRSGGQAVDRIRVARNLSQRPGQDELAIAVATDQPESHVAGDARSIRVDRESRGFPRLGWISDLDAVDRYFGHSAHTLAPGDPMYESAPAATAAISPELPFGATLQGGRYEIHRKLGRGGFGITYAATD